MIIEAHIQSKKVLANDYSKCQAIVKKTKLPGSFVDVAFTQIGNNFGYLHRLHFLASFLYISWI